MISILTYRKNSTRNLLRLIFQYCVAGTISFYNESQDLVRRITTPLVLKPTNPQVTLPIPKRIQLRREVPSTRDTRVIAYITHNRPPHLQRTTRHHPSRHRPLNMIRISLDRKIRNTDLIRQSLHQTRDSKIIRRQVVIVDVQFVVATVIDVLPLEFWVRGDEPGGGGVGFGLGDVLAVGAGGGDARAGEFDADCADAGGGVVGDRVEPDEVVGPGHVGVAGHEDVVCDLKQILVRRFAGEDSGDSRCSDRDAAECGSCSQDIRPMHRSPED